MARKHTLVSTILCCWLFWPTPVRAASDGSVGSESTGTQGVSLSIATLVRITGLENINFGKYAGTGNLSAAVDLCIWTNNADGKYKVRAEGSGASGAFTLTDGVTGTLPYEVRWNNTTGTSGNFAISTPQQYTSLLTGANTESSTCGGGRNANFQVTIQQAQLLARRPAIYTGVLTFVISP
ncbi:MAG: hypothetical protein EBZ48_10505 [Proteobacteria bacterium]|nr:hypothetical protein [Pseudomonadota bacterium]